MTKLILTILILGIILRLLISANGNFIFNMDNARDMVDVREMVVLRHLRLIGPTSAIEGFYTGPGWYYLLAIPFILSGGNPYASIIMEIILWAIGGFFLMRLASSWGKLSMLLVGVIWVASNFILLATQYAFNPNPVIFLTPLLIYLIKRYLEKEEFWIGFSIWFLMGLFFHFEMAAALFTPLAIVMIIFLIKRELLLSKNFYLGICALVITLAPQIFFELRHQFIMTHSVINYLAGGTGQKVNIFSRAIILLSSFYSTLLPTLMNFKLFTNLALVLFMISLVKMIKTKASTQDKIFIISFLLVFIPFLGFIILPIQVNRWHWDASMVAAILLVAFTLKKIMALGWWGKILDMVLFILVFVYGVSNSVNFIKEAKKPSSDPALLRNEIAAIDYVYKYADGKNFKVYTYLPSIYDYPYQYLFWWYGNKKYGYIPGEYAYSPNKPPYIPSQDKFAGLKTNFSGLVFLIKEPNRNYTRFGWEGDFIKYNWQPIEKKMVGPLEVEIRKEKAASSDH